MSVATPSVDYPDVSLLTDASARTYVEHCYSLMDTFAERARYFLQEKVDEELFNHLSSALGLGATYEIPRVPYEAAGALYRNTPKYKKGAIVENEEDGKYAPPGIPDRITGEFPAGVDGEGVRAYFEALQSCEGRKHLLKEMQRSRDLLKEFTQGEEAGWELAAEYASGHTYVRTVEGSGLKSFKVVGFCKAKLLDIFPVIYEPECYPAWFPFMKSSKEVAAFTRFHKIIHSEISCPWPITNRDLVLEASGIDDVNRGRVIINIADLSPTSEHYIPEKGLVRASMPIGGYMLELISHELTRISFYCHVDVKLHMPDWLLNFSTKQLVNMIVSNMESMAHKVHKPKSVYLPYMEAHQQIYKDVQQIVVECFDDPQEEEDEKKSV